MIALGVFIIMIALVFLALHIISIITIITTTIITTTIITITIANVVCMHQSTSRSNTCTGGHTCGNLKKKGMQGMEMDEGMRVEQCVQNVKECCAALINSTLYVCVCVVYQCVSM